MADDAHDGLIRGQLVGDVGGLLGVGLVVQGDDLEHLAIDAARGVGLLDGQTDAAQRAGTLLSGAAGQGQSSADLDGIPGSGGSAAIGGGGGIGRAATHEQTEGEHDCHAGSKHTFFHIFFLPINCV